MGHGLTCEIGQASNQAIRNGPGASAVSTDRASLTKGTPGAKYSASHDR